MIKTVKNCQARLHHIPRMCRSFVVGRNWRVADGKRGNRLGKFAQGKLVEYICCESCAILGVAAMPGRNLANNGQCNRATWNLFGTVPSPLADTVTRELFSLDFFLYIYTYKIARCQARKGSVLIVSVILLIRIFIRLKHLYKRGGGNVVRSCEWNFNFSNVLEKDCVTWSHVLNFFLIFQLVGEIIKYAREQRVRKLWMEPRLIDPHIFLEMCTTTTTTTTFFQQSHLSEVRDKVEIRGLKKIVND